MGDSMSWAADRADEIRQASPEYKANELLCALHNKLMAQVPEMKVAKLNFSDLQFLLGRESDVDPWWTTLKEADVYRLEGIVNA